ncbi:MAG: transposase [Candidatus Omnitrophota bacterium]
MSRTKRLYYSNAVYHVSLRGNNRQMVLKEDSDKIEFLKTLSRFKERFKYKLFGFVVMDNHPHLVIGVNGVINISKIMQAIALSYSQKFRHKYKYTGYVWQGRFKSNVIDSGEYILHCLEYIHNNPVRAKMVNHPEEYRWSSYRFYQEGINSLQEFILIDKFTP